MRDKEAIEIEKKNISRNIEKQAKAVEKLVESERLLLQQIVSGCGCPNLMTVLMLMPSTERLREGGCNVTQGCRGSKESI